MSFRISLSGMNAASSDLNVVSNNIANSNTTGFKSSRAEFGDVFAASVYGVSSNATGAGARLQRVAQQFTQGNIDFTGNSLDMAVSGQGFFTLSDNGTTVYSRAGNFSTDASGYVVNPSGQRLQVFAPNDDGTTFNTGKLSDLQLATGDAPPKVTTKVQASVTLPGNATAPTNSPFNAADPTTYSQTTSLTVYDSLGAAHTQSLYFSKTANANEWTVQTQIDGVSVGGAQTLTYDSSGALVSPANGQLALPAYTPPGGAGAMALSLDLSKSAQYGQKFAVSALNQDGYGTGSLSGISVSSEGVVQASYSNGVTKAIGQVALSSFASPQGLQQKGDNAFAETFASGQAVRGAAGTSDFGLVQGGALEASNVDQTAELVNMISAQRNFQANAQMIQTQDQITQTIINLR
ncbi:MULTISPECIES: flagellar hook protein FlgE [Pseudoxanthomonas]|uniref:Flagellar hook protein FlgE n=1 Tax=Pseudoxanthomonas winnipegensis TaxID=2480810 RepID=A0AAW8GCH8_9GAMM|nr:MULTISPECIES: flagellar hook protein FlgE [Pseudoxanthomonas]MDQ1120130.1 flagellar hook protein FlgE [Pseudoxanthomonas winnipegensis]MDQ1133340.1 flagellar hook protein FlgE [Pseudoxanthomonas winnipegensis]MDR6140414.1 flagellar hook protein FlgE [Pseudoxanthomonas sp. SORGH_AS_0997]